MEMYNVVFNDYNYLEHHGIKGQKWGIRRYQNPDGSLTEEGRKRYGSPERLKMERALAVQGTVGGTWFGALAGIGAGIASSNPIVGAAVGLTIGAAMRAGYIELGKMQVEASLAYDKLAAQPISDPLNTMAKQKR